MPTPAHPDAFGYINDLISDVGAPWFTELAQLATIHGQQTLDAAWKSRVLELFHAGVSQTAAPATSQATVSVTPAASDGIEWLGEFENFKLLQNSLKIALDKRVTIIFGKNGTGKTSICDSVKILVNPEEPKRPINNVRSNAVSLPQFKVKLRSEAAARVWKKGDRLGSLTNTVKYFDAEIAGRNVQSAVEPSRIVELTPFKLHAFNTIRSFVTEIRDALVGEHETVKSEIASSVKHLVTMLGSAGNSTFPGGVVSSSRLIEQAIVQAKTFPGPEAVAAQQAAAVEMEKATSEQGLKVLSNEARDTARLIEVLKKISAEVDRLWTIKPGTATKQLSERQAEQAALSKTLIPPGVQQEAFVGFLKAAQQVHDLAAVKHDHVCPLCRQSIGVSGENIFHEYHKLITNALAQEIIKLKSDVGNAARVPGVLEGLVPQDLDAWTVDQALRADAANAMRQLLSNTKSDADETPAGTAAKVGLMSVITKLENSHTQKTTALAVAARDMEEPKRKLAILREDIAKAQDLGKLHAALPELNKTLSLVQKESRYKTRIPTITNILTKVSVARRTAHTTLVFGSFEERLNREYLALAEKKMEHFGVVLTPKTQRDENSAMVLEPLVGPNPQQRTSKNTKSLDDVLSEGEKRMHALALFFAEAETSGHSVVVFDDPVSSFDYNFVENFCCRLRDFIGTHSAKQIIVLTHNWEFFTQLQLKIKHFRTITSIQILEAESTLGEYSERIDDLKRLIEPVLAAHGEPTQEKKKSLAANMRRLIEAIVNTHVFNDQRQQYKCKDVKVSVFREFTSIVPLTTEEANRLSDLFSKLSVTEHDDHRNLIVNTDKAAYQTRYQQIIDIETAIKTRTPVTAV